MDLVSAPRVVIVILSWDSLQNTLTCLKAARQTDYPDFKILVVDNACQPELAVTLSQEYPDVHLLQNSTNLGYAGGNNLGIRWAMEQGADYMLLLNDDLILEPATCRKLVSAAWQEPNRAALGGKVRPVGEPGWLWSAGEAFPREAPLQSDEGQYDQPRPVRYVAGCCVLLSRLVLEQVGLFDEAYFLLHEEKDWCRRARQAGFQCWYTPDAIAWHNLEDSLTHNPSPTYHYLYVRNNLVYWQKGGQRVNGIFRLYQAAAYTWQEIIFIRHYRNRSLRFTWAALRGAADFLTDRLGTPPPGL